MPSFRHASVQNTSRSALCELGVCRSNPCSSPICCTRSRIVSAVSNCSACYGSNKDSGENVGTHLLTLTFFICRFSIESDSTTSRQVLFKLRGISAAWVHYRSIIC